MKKKKIAEAFRPSDLFGTQGANCVGSMLAVRIYYELRVNVSVCRRAEKPAFLTDLKRVTPSEYGRTVTLPCDAYGVPQPTIQWFRNAEPVDKLLGTR